VQRLAHRTVRRGCALVACRDARRAIRRATPLADHDHARGDAGTHPQWLDERPAADSGNVTRKCERCPDGALGIVFMGARIAEIGDESIRGALRDDPAMPPNHVRGAVVVRRHDFGQVFRIQVRRQRPGAGDAGGQDRQLPPFRRAGACNCRGRKQTGSVLRGHACIAIACLRCGSGGLAHFRDETQSLARDGPDHPLLCAGVADGAAERSDPAAERGLRNDPALPDRREHLVLADDARTIEDQEMEEVEDLRLHRDTGALTPQFPSPGIE
jgi:hypothetical protein